MKKKLPLGKLPLPLQKIDSRICSQKNCLPENPWKNKCAGKYTNLKNNVYIVVDLFVIVFGIFEGIRNVETLIVRVAWLKNTCLPQYFNLKSGKRLDVLILLAFLVFLNIQKIKQSGEAWPVVNNLVHPRSSNYKKLSNSGRNYFLNLNAESWTEVLEREFGCYPFWQKVNYLTFTIIRYPIVCTN